MWLFPSTSRHGPVMIPCTYMTLNHTETDLDDIEEEDEDEEFDGDEDDRGMEDDEA